jgi:hypothetical protein
MSCSELHGLIYSYLDWGEKLNFISISREIYLSSGNYRQLKLKQGTSRQYVSDELFRKRLNSLVSRCNIELNLQRYDLVTNAEMESLEVQSLDITGCKQISDAGLAHLGGVRSLNASNCNRITDAGMIYLGRVHHLVLLGCTQITDAGLTHLGWWRSYVILITLSSDH